MQIIYLNTSQLKQFWKFGEISKENSSKKLPDFPGIFLDQNLLCI
jgi:hypothetical protein